MFKILKQDGIKYAYYSGDFNEIHLNDIVGYNSMFGEKICHGTFVYYNCIKKYKLIKKKDYLNGFSLKIIFNKHFKYNEIIYLNKKKNSVFQNKKKIADIIFKKKYKYKINNLILRKIYKFNKSKYKKKNHELFFILSKISNYVGMIFPGKYSLISDININYIPDQKKIFDNNIKIYSKKKVFTYRL